MSVSLAAMIGRHPSRMRPPSIRITGLAISQHDQAVRILEKIANSVFFQIDLLANLPLTLIRERPTLRTRSEEHTSELQSQSNLVCRLLLEKKNTKLPR